MRIPCFLIAFLSSLTAGFASAQDEPGKEVARLVEGFLKVEAPFRRSDFERLKEADPKGEASAKQLREALKSDEPPVRFNAAYALWRLRGQALEELLEGFEALLRKKDATRRELSDLIEEIKMLGAKARPLASALVEYSDRHCKEDEGFRALEVVAITGARDVVAKLRPLSTDKTRSLRYRLYVEWTIWKLNGDTSTIRPMLEAALKTKDSKVALTAVWVVSELGKPAVPLLEDVVMVHDHAPRSGVPRVLEEFGEAAIPAFRKGMTELKESKAKEDLLFRLARLALGKDGEPLAKAIPVVALGIKDPMPKVRQKAAFILGGLKKQAQPHLAELKQARERERDAVTKIFFDASIKSIEEAIAKEQ